MKRKKLRFNVKLCIEELSSVPLVSGILFTKLRLDDGSKYSQFTPRMEVRDHCVRWNQDFTFPCKVTASSDTGILDNCTCRLSVRKEIKGGRTYQKLGYADLNLSEYACQGQVKRSYILQGYSEKHRLDNSTIRVYVLMTLESGDILFKVPTPEIPTDLGVTPSCDDLTLQNKGDNLMSEANEESGTSNSSGFDSLTRIPKTPPISSCHSRNSSSVSNISIGYGTGGRPTAGPVKHCRNASSGSNKIPINLRKTGQRDRAERIDSTRVDADDLVNQLLGDVSLDDSQEAKGLQLYIAQDGSATVTGHSTVGKDNSLHPVHPANR